MAWIALSYRGTDYTAKDLIAAANRFLEGSGNTFSTYEIYDDCNAMNITAVKPDGSEVECLLSLDDLPEYTR